MARKLKSDKILFLATFLLVCASVVMVYSASAVLAFERYQQPYLFLIKQAMWAAMGLAAVGLIMRFDYHNYREPALIWTSLIVVVAGLIAVLFMPAINNAHRWLGVGGMGVQPSELAKLSVIFFIAAILERRMHRINEVRYALTPIAVVVVFIVLLILLEPDFGTSMSLVTIAVVMVFAAGLNYRYLIGTALVTLPVICFVLISAPYRRRRLLAFWNPWEDPLGDGFQIIQSIIAVGTGGVFGRGLMAGVQKLFYLPTPHTDFIFSVIAEELGLVGATVVLLCFCVIAWRGMTISMRAPDMFGAFLALGLTAMISVQALVNISVVLGLLPTKGIPLPFVSAGGSSLLISLIGTGILLNVSQHATRDA